MPKSHTSYKDFKDPIKAVDYLIRLYDAAITKLREAFEDFVQGKNPEAFVVDYYPAVMIDHKTHEVKTDIRSSFGYLGQVGAYKATITRPLLYRQYLIDQFSHILKNHPDVTFKIGPSSVPIPIHFAFKEGIHVEGNLTKERHALLSQYFSMPDLSTIDDAIVNCDYNFDSPYFSLSLFSASRVDYSLHRLKHYTATDPEHFQNFVLYTNYQFYIDKFVSFAEDLMKKPYGEDNPYTAFVKPGNIVLTRDNIADYNGLDTFTPQMPAYHLKREDGSGITIVNIGVGPSNAKTITDHIGVLRPHAWIMLGHCAGLRASQVLGEYCLAHGYVREDHVLDDVLPLNIPLPALSEIQLAIEKAVAEITGQKDYDMKSIMRTGTVVSTDNRNWELDPYHELIKKFSLTRAIALDMESAVIAANGFRHRVPYGALLCVSDKPLHGEIKLPGMANHFYKNQVDQHLKIGIKTMEILRETGAAKLHSRKLRSFFEGAFR